MTKRNSLVAAGVALAAVSSIAAMAGATPAAASWQNKGTCEAFDTGLQTGGCYDFVRPNGTGTGLVWLGTYTGPGGWQAWCIDFLYGTNFGVSGTRTTVTSLTNSSGQTIGSQERAALAYLATKYSPALVNDQDAAAIALIIREVMSDGYSSGSNITLFPGGLQVGQQVAAPHAALGFPTDVLARARALWDDASDYIGVWTVTLNKSWESLDPGESTTFTATVKSATGTPVANEWVAVSYNNATGPAMVQTNSQGRATIPVTAQGSGGWGIRVNADSPGTNPEIWRPNDWTTKPFGATSTKTQRVLGTAAPTKVTVSAEGWTRYIGLVGTSASDKADGDKYLPSSGGTITDTVTYSGLEPWWPHTIYGELYDKATGQPTGITAEHSFTTTATNTSGTAHLDFHVPASLAGRTLVVVETIVIHSDDDYVAAEHFDLNDQSQTVYMPSLQSFAVDRADGDKTLPTGGGQVTDTLTYAGLRPGTSYTINGVLVDKATGAQTNITATRTFTPSTSSGTVDLTFTVPSGFSGDDLVAYQTISVGGKTVAEHRDINSASQTVAVAGVPATIGTTAVDAADGDKYLPAGGGTVVDTVAYTGLTPGQQYTLTGRLMDKLTGQPSGVTASRTFTPAAADGTVTLDFVVPGSQAGKALVAFEAITRAGTQVVAHEDINDPAQTVYVPAVGTTAVDKADGDRTVAAEGGTVTDTVAYSGLQPGVEYTVTGVLQDKETGDATTITGQTVFTPASSSGTVNVDFAVPATMRGRTLVAFETLRQGTVVVAAHTDLNDAAQTVAVANPSIGTSAADKADGDKFLPAGGGTVTDTVTYTGLTPGTSYTLTGALVDKATGDPTGVTANRTFTPTAADGTVTLDFAVPAGLAGRVLVAYETVTAPGGAVTAEHADLGDPAQTVYVPAVGTTATDQADGDKQLPLEGGRIKDVVAYTGLQPGVAYTVNGVLHDKASGESTGITAQATFTPDSPSGTVDLVFDVPAGYGGKNLVVFEVVSTSGKQVAAHTDIDDTAQTVGVATPVPTVRTSAVDAADGDKFLPAGGGTITDTVTYTDLNPGQQYTLSGELVDKASGQPTGVTANRTFTPTAPDGTVTLDFVVPDGQAGKALVVFETISQDATEIASHRDLGDAAQTFYLPAVGTTATDQADGDKQLPLEGGRIRDVVAYSGLQPGVEYTVTGALHDKASGEPTGITAQATFTPADTSGTVDVMFDVPAGHDGENLVVFEVLTVSGLQVAAHTDINDAAQTVGVAAPSIGTSAVDAADGDKFLPAGGGTITDTVTYTGLTPGVEYTLDGVLHDKATGDPVGVTASRTFTPAAADGTVTLDFAVPASQAGKVLVVFETVSQGATLVAEHADIGDAAQTFYVPAVGTTAVDDADGDHFLAAGGGTVVDTVAYAGLQPGVEYTVTGALHDKASGEPTGITGQTTFTPASPSGTVEVEFTVGAGHVGETLVAYETVKLGVTAVAEHADLDDAAQAVTVANPAMGTTAVDKADGDKYLPAGGGTVVDTVSYSDLTPGVEYTLTGELVDKASGAPTGIVGSRTFTPAAASGTVTMEFPVTAAQAGKTLVAFERILQGAATILTHEDLNDAAQTVSVPTIATSATDQADGDKQLAPQGGFVVDTVTYSGLRPGTEYVVSGELHDKASGEPTGITGSTTFTPASPSGTAEVVFNVPAGQDGSALVAFEYLQGAGTLIVQHTDIADTAQTVYVPQAATTAVDKADSDKQVPQAGGTVTDTVSYSGLVPGQQYTLNGALHDKASGEATGVTASRTFTPGEHSGTVDLDFVVPAGQAGKTLVAFEAILNSSGELVVEHADIDDEAQTVYVANLATVATDKADGDKTLSIEGGTLVDTVTYAGLTPGAEYTLNGVLMDKASGAPTSVTGSVTFTAAASSGSVEVEFVVPAGLGVTDLVVFETLQLSGEKVAEHADLNDEAQSVTVDEFLPPAPANNLPLTGGDGTAGALAGLGAVLVAGFAALVGRVRGRRGRDE